MEWNKSGMNNLMRVKVAKRKITLIRKWFQLSIR